MVVAMAVQIRRATRAGPPVQIPAGDLELLRQVALRTNIPENVLFAVAVRSLAGLGRKEIASLVRIYYDLAVPVRPSDVDL
jgi:hypothetical protein